MPLERYPDLELQLHLANFSLEESPIPQKKWTYKLPLDELEVIYVMGLFEGAPFLELEAWLEKGKHLVFLEDNLEAVHRLVSKPWAKRCLHHPHVHLKFLQAPKDWSLEQIAQEFPCHKVAVIGRRTPLKLSLLRKTVLWHSLTSEVLSGPLLHRNIFSNLQRLPSSFYVNQTRNAFSRRPAIICGAGPSLSQAVHELPS